MPTGNKKETDRTEGQCVRGVRCVVCVWCVVCVFREGARCVWCVMRRVYARCARLFARKRCAECAVCVRCVLVGRGGLRGAPCARVGAHVLLSSTGCQISAFECCVDPRLVRARRLQGCTQAAGVHAGCRGV